MSTGGLLEDKCVTSPFDFDDIGTVNEKSDDESESTEFLRGMAMGHSGSGDSDGLGNSDEFSNGKEFGSSEEPIGNATALPLDLVLPSSDTADCMEQLSVLDMEWLTVDSSDGATISEFPRSVRNCVIHINLYK
jgi:hypothetical protein